MKKVGFYHIYLTDEIGTWSGIALEQWKIMQEKGIFDYLDEFNVTAITKSDGDAFKSTAGRIDKFVGLLNTFTNKWKVEMVVHPYANDQEMLAQWGSTGSMKFSENRSMQKIWDLANHEDAVILYAHTKGITAPLQYLNRGDYQKMQSYHYWRAFLNWGVLENWQECVNAVGPGPYFRGPMDYDIAGVNYFSTPAPHFSGNFWWSKSSYIKTLPDPATKDWWHDLQAKTTDQWLKTAPDRFSDEMWVLSKPGVKIFSSKNLDKPTNLGQEYLPRSAYAS